MTMASSPLWQPEGESAEREWRSRFKSERQQLLARPGAINSTATYAKIGAAATRLFDEISTQLRVRIQDILIRCEDLDLIGTPDEAAKLILDPLVQAVRHALAENKQAAEGRGFKHVLLLRQSIQPHTDSLVAAGTTVRNQIRNEVTLRRKALEPKSIATPDSSASQEITVTFRKTLLQSGKPVADGVIRAAFTPEERQLIESYHRHATRLRTSPLVAKGLPELQNASLVAGKGWSFVFTPFDWHDAYTALHLARPLILTNEPASFDRIRGILAKRFTQTEVREHLGKLLKHYQNGFYQGSAQIKANAIPVFDERTFVTWLNARQYHTDPDKQAQMETLSNAFGTDNTDSLMVVHLSARINAVLEMDRTLIHTVLEQLKAQ